MLGLPHGNPSPPELKEITIDPSTTVLNMMNRAFGAIRVFSGRSQTCGAPSASIIQGPRCPGGQPGRRCSNRVVNVLRELVAHSIPNFVVRLELSSNLPVYGSILVNPAKWPHVKATEAPNLAGRVQAQPNKGRIAGLYCLRRRAGIATYLGGRDNRGEH